MITFIDVTNLPEFPVYGQWYLNLQRSDIDQKYVWTVVAPNVQGLWVAVSEAADGSLVTQSPLPRVVATGSLTAQAAAVASVTACTPVDDTTFVVQGNILVTAGASYGFTMTCAYTDTGGTSRTLTMLYRLLDGTDVATIGNANGNVPYQGQPLTIRAKAGTAITIATTGTFTTVTYNVDAQITQAA